MRHDLYAPSLHLYIHRYQLGGFWTLITKEVTSTVG